MGGKSERYRGTGPFKAAAFSMCMLASAYMGDTANITDRVINPLLYRGVEAEDYFTDQPFSLEKRVILNGEGRLETYLGIRGTDEYYRVRHTNHTARPIDDFVDGSRKRLEHTLDRLRDNALYWGALESLKYGIGNIFF